MCFLVSYFFHVLFLLSTLRLARHEVTHSQNGNLNTPRRPAPAEGARARLQDDRPLRRQLSRRAQARAPALLRPAARGTVPAGSSCSSSWLPSGGDSPGHCVSLPGRKCAGGLRAGSASGARAPSRRGLQPLGVAAAPGALSVRGWGQCCLLLSGTVFGQMPISADLPLSCGLGTILLLVLWLLRTCERPPVSHLLHALALLHVVSVFNQMIFSVIQPFSAELVALFRPDLSVANAPLQMFL